MIGWWENKTIKGTINNKDDKRKAAQSKRMEWELKNWGNYELLYPSVNTGDNVKYAKYSEEAMNIWEKFTGSYKQSTPKLKSKLQKGSSSSITSSTRASKSKWRLI